MSLEIVRYTCRNCRYGFRRAADKEVSSRCGYCGHHQVEREDSINKLIGE